MSIQDFFHPIHEMEGTPPSKSDPRYWAYRYRMESDRARRYPNKPNPELETNMRAYWNNLLCREEKSW